MPLPEEGWRRFDFTSTTGWWLQHRFYQPSTLWTSQERHWIKNAKSVERPRHFIKQFNGINILQARDFVNGQDRITSWMARCEASGLESTHSDESRLGIDTKARNVKRIRGPSAGGTSTWNRNGIQLPARDRRTDICHDRRPNRYLIPNNQAFPVLSTTIEGTILYQALKQIFVYLNATRDQGLTYWCSEPNLNLPYVEHQSQHWHQAISNDSQKPKKQTPSPRICHFMAFLSAVFIEYLLSNYTI